MKKLIAALIVLASQPFDFAQGFAQGSAQGFGSPQGYWQQQVNYTIQVSLNDKQHTLSGSVKIEYVNNSPDTLDFIWFHVWPNAYKNDKTAFSDQLLENGNTSFYFSEREEKGYINRLDFKVDGLTAETEDHPHHIDIIKLVLPTPLSPGQKTSISTAFHVKLPYNFSRGGHVGESYQVTQWYPKPAVYDKNGWHPMPYLDQGEYYGEFGNYDVSIAVPSNYVVAATGALQNADEREWLKKRADFTWEPIRKRVKKGSTVKTTVQEYPGSATDIKILRYQQDNVHDFAWFADKRFIVSQDTCLLPSGRIIDVYSYYTPSQAVYWKNTVGYAKDAIRTRSTWIGEYPFSVVSVVQGPESFGGGMEYPTITVISPTDDEKQLDFTIAHEIGHNWFYGILGSNERAHPWMDEGLNTYYDNRYSKLKHGNKGELNLGFARTSIKNLERVLFQTLAVQKKDQPINTTSEKFTAENYNLVAYYKTGAWLEWLEQQLGTETFDRAMQEYFRRWQFRHPQPADLKTVFEAVSARNLDSAFSVLDKTGIIPGEQAKGTRSAFVFSYKKHSSYLNNPSDNYLLFGPSVGFNNYDKLMIGGFVTNYKLPPSRLQFFMSPMLGTRSGSLAGMGLINYSFYPSGIFRKINLGVAGATYSINDFENEAGDRFFGTFYKLVPSLKFVLKEKNSRSSLHRYIQFKSFMIGEDRFNFYRDTIVGAAGDTSILTKIRNSNDTRTLNQLRIVSENTRTLYPWRGELKIEQGKSFVRAGFTGNYFFNYASGGGLSTRFFAGKFFYSGSRTIRKQFETDRYHLNMTGPNGYEDYTYSDYFIGRNEFEGLASQQLMIRDGGFKVRTELLADKVGKTDDWLMALNFSTTIPSSINPLKVLPFDIPLKIFADVGTYSDAWDKNATEDRFLFDAGLQVPILNETINIYIPLIYSKVYKDYIRSTLEKKNRFFRTISFSIDMSAFNLRKKSRNMLD